MSTGALVPVPAVLPATELAATQTLVVRVMERMREEEWIKRAAKGVVGAAPRGFVG